MKSSPATLTDRLNAVHPQMLRVKSESDRKKLAVGRRVERAFEILGITKQDAAFQMAYADAGTVSRWCSGTETPLFHKLEIIDGFEGAYAIALAENNPQMEVETIVRIRGRRVA